MRVHFPRWQALGLLIGLLTAGTCIAAEGERVLLWGDTHLHTSYSFDAFLNGNLTADPDTAYRFAKGEAVLHPYHGVRVRINTPLDFLVVSDHAEALGVMASVYRAGYRSEGVGLIERLVNWYRARVLREAIATETGDELFHQILPRSADPLAAAAVWRANALDNGPSPESIAGYSLDAWHHITTTADLHNRPGEFTALIGWEWSSTPGGANLHRIVVTDADGALARGFLPFSSVASPYPEDLWAWLEKTSMQTGATFVSIPHNSNLSKGVMFSDRTLRGERINAAYAKVRMRWEPVVEVTQIKGDSETHPSLSPGDEFADFETYSWYLQREMEPYKPAIGDYIRPALTRGMMLGVQIGVNPFQFGLIGSTDAHTGLSSAEERNFWGKMATDSIPQNKRGTAPGLGLTGWSMSAQGLAAVWAEENTRQAVVAAFQRRETYATTGTRIVLRFLGGWGLRERDLQNWRRARTKGVPMGGILKREFGQIRAPLLLVQALRDPLSAPLDRIQIVKGWIDGVGEAHEQVYDVAWFGAKRMGADGVLAPLENNLALRTGNYEDVGAGRLQVAWRDPQFDPVRPAFYYVRVLEAPTVRHSQLDAVSLGLDEPDLGARAIQERAYSSPIWYEP